MFRLLTITLFACTGTVCSSSLEAAQQVELRLNSGQVVKGEIIEQNESVVKVKSALSTKSGPMSVTMAYKRDDIVSMVTLDDPEVAYAKRAKAATAAEDHASLATWCREQALMEHAVEQARLALSQNPEQPVAKGLLSDLGWIQAGGNWVKESDWLNQQGKVRYHGQIMSIAEADALKAKTKEDHAVAEMTKDVEGKTAYIASLDKQIAEIQERPAQLDAALAKANSGLVSAQAILQRVLAAKAAWESAEGSLTSAQVANQRQTTAPGTTYNPPTNLAPYYQAVEAAKQAFNQARQDAGNAENEVAHLQAEIVSLGEERKNLERKKADLAARRLRATKELETAKMALAQHPPTTPAQVAPTQAVRP